MIDFVSEKALFAKLKKKYLNIFSKNVPLEQNPFDGGMKHFLIFELDFIFHDAFLKEFKTFLEAIGETRFTWFTVSPSPVSFFYETYKKFSVVEITTDITDRGLSQILMKDPGGNPADAIIYSDDFVLFSESEEWAISLSRGIELGVVGFRKESVLNKFLFSFENDINMFSTVDEHIQMTQEHQMVNNHWNKMLDELKESYG